MDQALICRICIENHFSAPWADWFGDLHLENGADGRTWLTGRLADQAALHGLLARLRDLGLTLVTLEVQPLAAAPDSSVLDPSAPAADQALLVDLRQVTKRYEMPGTASGGFDALRQVDLTVGRGEFLSIVGKSGSGKSTLINMITGIDRPTAGEVWVGGAAVHTLDEEQIARWRGRTLGVIFQFFQLFPTLTAVENVMLPMDNGRTFSRHERPERAMHLLEQVGMADQAHYFPAELSGGQQQCVAIARALANDPPLLAADEPTGNLDSSSAERVLALFQMLIAGGKTLLVVTHDGDLAAQAGRTVVLADGRIVEQRINRQR